MNNEQLFCEHRVLFDDGDKLNGSLYLCFPPDSEAAGSQAAVVDLLRREGLWSATGLAQVRDDQRQAYAEQLQLLDHREYPIPGGTLVVARCEHPKYPSSATRWQAWLDCLEGNRELLAGGRKA